MEIQKRSYKYVKLKINNKIYDKFLFINDDLESKEIIFRQFYFR